MTMFSDEQIDGWDKAPLITEPDRLKQSLATVKHGETVASFITCAAERAGPRARFVRFGIDPDLLGDVRTMAAIQSIEFGESLEQVAYRLEFIRVAPELFINSAATIKFVIAHEMGHLLNGDLQNPKFANALKKVGGWTTDEKTKLGNWTLEDPNKLDSYKTIQRAEYAADQRALSLFPTNVEAAGAMAAFSVFLKQTGRKYSRLSLHPSPQARLRAGRRHLARPFEPNRIS